MGGQSVCLRHVIRKWERSGLCDLSGKPRMRHAPSGCCQPLPLPLPPFAASNCCRACAQSGAPAPQLAAHRQRARGAALAGGSVNASPGRQRLSSIWTLPCPQLAGWMLSGRTPAQHPTQPARPLPRGPAILLLQDGFAACLQSSLFNLAATVSLEDDAATAAAASGAGSGAAGAQGFAAAMQFFTQSILHKHGMPATQPMLIGPCCACLPCRGGGWGGRGRPSGRPGAAAAAVFS